MYKRQVLDLLKRQGIIREDGENLRIPDLFALKIFSGIIPAIALDISSLAKPIPFDFFRKRYDNINT